MSNEARDVSPGVPFLSDPPHQSAPRFFLLLGVLLLLGWPVPGAAQTTCTANDLAVTGAVTGTPDLTGLVADCTTLLGLKDDLRGTGPLNWAVGVAMDVAMTSWDGITVGGAPPRVTVLRIRDNNQLTGTLPAALGNLTELEILDLQGNQLTGTIPTTVGNLTELVYLSFHENQLTGTIPTTVGNLTKLRDLYIGGGGNQLSGTIPTELGNLTNLEILDLGQNNLNGSIPMEVGKLVKLTNLALWGNQLSDTIPTELGKLTKMMYLNLSQNNLNGSIPMEVGDLVKLRILRLNSNQLSGAIPTELGNLTQLARLFLNRNQLSGAIPTELGALTNLEYLWLDNNQLTGAIPTELSSLTAVSNLDFSYNAGLTGGIPSWLGSLTALEYLYLRFTGLSGAIPTELGNLTNLRQLILNNNQLSGAIPVELGALTMLRQLRLNNNQLSDPIPTELGALTNLEVLWLQNNQLTGAIPTELSSLTAVSNLNFSYNAGLTGGIPSWLGSLTALEYLYLRFTGLSGAIPAELGALTNLRELVLNNNQLSGNIPAALGDLTNLSKLHLHLNEDLTGPLVVSSDFQQGEVYLYATKWTGTIPQTLLDAEAAGNLHLLTNRRPRPPVDIPNVYIEPGADFCFIIPRFHDEEGEEMTYHVTRSDGGSLPSWLRFDAARRGVSGRPPQAGDFEVAVTATDEDTPPRPPTAATPFCDPTRGFNEEGRFVGDELHPPALCAVSPSSFFLKVMDDHGRPRNIQLAPRDGTVTVTWDPPMDTDGITGYKVRHRQLGIESWTEVPNLLSANPPRAYTIMNLTTGTLYEVQVRAVVMDDDNVYWSASRKVEATLPRPRRPRRPRPPPPPPPPPLPVWYWENPRPASFQSGIGVISGWVCKAEVVEIEFNGGLRTEAAYGTERADTAKVCGDTDNGFGLLFNWNLLGDGAHTVVVRVDGVELGRVTVEVTTLGEEFVEEVAGETLAVDFPAAGHDVRLVWQQSVQNFMLAPPEGLPTTRLAKQTVPRKFLENPGPAAFQSGIGVLSGWMCEAAEVVLEINGEPWPAAYGTARADTAEVCGDSDNGFGLLFNWNLLGDGAHTVVALADGEEFGRATVTVTTLGEEFVEGASSEALVLDFPEVGTDVRLVWQEVQQNFVITGVEP